MMKKHFKKLVSLVLSATMVMGVSTVAFAAEETNVYTTRVCGELGNHAG